jgi:hypothetical protein
MTAAPTTSSNDRRGDQREAPSLRRLLITHPTGLASPGGYLSATGVSVLPRSSSRVASAPACSDEPRALVCRVLPGEVARVD